MHEAVCVYDQAERLGVEVWFVDYPSLEGMYVRPPDAAPYMLVSSLRPTGRQSLTAAHELGHHAFRHGTRIDQYVAGAAGTDADAAPATDTAELVAPRTRTTFDADEFLADLFGAFFLMPKAAVARGFSARALSPATATPAEVFAVAGWLGVGYTTLVYHMRASLGLIDEARARRLLAAKPKSIRAQLLGEPTPHGLVLVDAAWTGRPVDLQVGDIALVPHGTALETSSGAPGGGDTGGPGTLVPGPGGRALFEATTPGIGRLVGDGWAAFVRVAERAYKGRNMHRHLERAEDDELEGDRPKDDDLAEGERGDTGNRDVE